MSLNEPQITAQTLAVLMALRDWPREGLSGAQIARSTKLASGTLYPILGRLEQAGWLESQWEAGDPHALGRPRRRYYQVTAIGERGARAEARRMDSAIGGLLCD